jgi:hypothetical protein
MNFQFKWTEANCVTGNCFMNYSANAETLEYACYEVITRHLDPTGLLMWDFNELGASSSLGTLKHVPETVSVVDTTPLTSPNALEKDVWQVEDTSKVHWPSDDEEIATPSKLKAQKPKKS